MVTNRDSDPDCDLNPSPNPDPLLELWPFTFALNLRLAQEAAEAPDPEEGAANALPAAPTAAGAAGAAGATGAASAAGSQGEGLKLLNRSAVLGLRGHYTESTSTTARSSFLTNTFCCEEAADGRRREGHHGLARCSRRSLVV